MTNRPHSVVSAFLTRDSKWLLCATKSSAPGYAAIVTGTVGKVRYNHGSSRAISMSQGGAVEAPQSSPAIEAGVHEV